jgi:hypothetical protein
MTLGFSGWLRFLDFFLFLSYCFLIFSSVIPYDERLVYIRFLLDFCRIDWQMYSEWGWADDVFAGQLFMEHALPRFLP